MSFNVLIEELRAILADEEKLLEIISEELLELKERYADKRRTEITLGGAEMIEDEDLIPVENSVLTLTHNGYIKRLPANTYRSQRRGGRGIQGMGTNDDDFVEHMLNTQPMTPSSSLRVKGGYSEQKVTKYPSLAVQLKDCRLLTYSVLPRKKK